MAQKVVPVILSGGSGSRLWPVSRGSYPKQFWPLLNDHTLIQETALRGSACGSADPIIVCNADHRFIIAEQLREAGIKNPKIVLEPVGRNSAPAIAAAAFLVAQEDPDAILWVMAADAAITDLKSLQDSLQNAVLVAQSGWIATFGMKPTKPETGYGYIEAGSPIQNIPQAYEVARFIEKPSLDIAQELIQSDKYFWNSGMFLAKAKVFLSEIRSYEPEIYTTIKQSVQHCRVDMDFIRLDEESFQKSPNISVDYAIAERTKLAAVIPGDFGWSDIGSWDSLWDLSPKDPQGNVVYGEHIFLDRTKNCYVRSDGIVTAVTGVDDLIVVVTSDAVMISHRDNAQDIKHVVARLSAAGRKEAVEHKRLYRPWGFYESLIQAERFQVKRIVVEPGGKLSLQKHYHRAEHWVVVAGTALVTRDNEQLVLRENESVYLPLGSVHRLENPGKIPLTLIEVQSGPYLGEDDIIRLEDVYERN
ncbi:mannose-1-phosphate guanylyltransferase/mannose-6-phosphate isomerase [Swingsia samuiensis]|uniref:mannose-1-phosphate guanylyltransferase n=1 Tax=Swingsia samuiensis TaxID=1293412 RepID=A0A4Y6UIC7_9PROT|nr:mannose-1-phosphate guanylyltransferase/mannose-6-phosphate isomerase [Swingsia samuiensis]QDH17333.1 mannose-1-phosphate guanylyltransferase/mannose-6-phosphate isomerase [Swingsia samuiensis]